MIRSILFAALAFTLAACGQRSAPTAAAPPPPPGLEEAVFAGGCFWCTEYDFEKKAGVVAAVSGYIGGRIANPSYEQVSRTDTGHYEAVKVTYDPGRVSYAELVEYFWRTVDPTDAGGQFCDRGESYRTAIFVTATQRPIAEASKAALNSSGALPAPIATPILDLATFWEAEPYHQDFATRNPVRYNYYRSGCGRDARLREVWGAAKTP